MNRRVWRFVSACGAAALVGGLLARPVAAAGPSGTLDTSWNHVGYTTTSFGADFSFADGVAVHGDQTVAVGGWSSSAGNVWALARYTMTGTLDPTFGSGGLVTTRFNGYDLADAAAYQGDKLVVAGYTSNDMGANNFQFALARYQRNGQLDPSFGSGGKVVTSFGSSTYDFADAVTVAGDKIIVAGESRLSGPNNLFIVARYNNNGTLDSSFGSGGFVTTDFGHGYNSANGVVLMGDAIIAAGYVLGGAGHVDFGVARYTKNGVLDSTFGSGGKVITDFGMDAAGHAVDVHGDQIAVVGAVLAGSGDHDFAAALYDRSGNMVPSFGSGGKATMDLGGDDIASAGGFSRDGSVVAAGDSASGTTDEFAVARWTKAGVADAQFGTGGHTLTAIGGMSGGFASAVSGDRLVVAGYSDNSFAVARYLT